MSTAVCVCTACQSGKRGSSQSGPHARFVTYPSLLESIESKMCKYSARSSSLSDPYGVPAGVPERGASDSHQQR